MKSILSYLLLCLIFLSLGSEGQSSSSNPPFIPGSPDFSTSNWVDLAKYYAPFFIVPIALGIILSLVLTFLNCITCCCPKCCCAPPCCLDSKFAIGILYTIGFAIICGACIAAWVHAPGFTQGVDIIWNSVESVISDISNFFEDSQNTVESLAHKLASALIPAFNTTAVNGTTNDVFQIIDDTRSLLLDMNVTIFQLEDYYKNMTGELTTIENEANNAGITLTNIPTPSDIPSPSTSSIFNISQILEQLDSLESDARSISSQLQNSVPSDLANLGQGYSFLPNFTLPFNFSSLLDKLDFGFNKILQLTGLTNPISYLNQTMSSFPISSQDFKYWGQVIDENGGIYTIVVCLFGATIVVAYVIWYLGLCTFSILHRAPFCWSAFIIIFMGIAIAIHLTFGTITNDFCYQKDQLVTMAIQKAYDAVKNQSLPQAVLGPLEKIAADPLLLVKCSGNDTVFGLYNVSLWDDLGFSDKINELLNGTSLPNLFPSNSSLDLGVQGLYDKHSQMVTAIDAYEIQASDWHTQMVDFSVQLATEFSNRGCPTVPYFQPCGPNPCCSIYFMQISTQRIIYDLDQVNLTLPQIQNQTQEFYNLIVRMEAARRTIVDTLAETLKFPDLSATLGTDIINQLGSCSWLGNFWDSIIGEAVCNKITPSLLWVGWCFAVVGVMMIFLTPVIIWSLNLGDGIV